MFFDSGDATLVCDCHYYSQTRKAAFLENLLLSKVIFATDAPELLLTDLTFKKNRPTLRWMSKVSKNIGCDRGCSHQQHVATDVFENMIGVWTEKFEKIAILDKLHRLSHPNHDTRKLHKRVSILYTSLASLT